jgi:pyruvate decarboxylase
MREREKEKRRIGFFARGCARGAARLRPRTSSSTLSLHPPKKKPLNAQEPRLKMVYTCNELNAGYAADGYARARGVACVIATFTVGGLSLLNAVAGAYSERLPVLVVTGAPNSNDFGTMRVLHHTTGRPGGGVTDEIAAFRPFVCHAEQIFALETAHAQLDTAISQALKLSRPAYVSIACNLAGLRHPTFEREPVPYSLAPPHTNPTSLAAAVETAVELLSGAAKPVLVGGVKLRPARNRAAFAKLADASKYAVAAMPNAKGMVDETSPRFMGTYWGQVSTPYCAEVVESADAYVFCGPIFNDYTSVGYSLLLKDEKMIVVDEGDHGGRVSVGGRRFFNCVAAADFMEALAARVTPNEGEERHGEGVVVVRRARPAPGRLHPIHSHSSSLHSHPSLSPLSAAWTNYERMYIPPGKLVKPPPTAPLRTNVLFEHVQSLLSDKTAVIAETGDSWFNCLKLRLPPGCGYEFQMQYGSIGWSVGAVLGYALGVRDAKRVIACIGDGSFQMTAQEVSTALRYGANPIIFLVNNKGYSIEVEIHDGEYNVINDWAYTDLVRAFAKPGSGHKLFTATADTEAELASAIEGALAAPEALAFIEVRVDKDDCSRELFEWGSRVASCNGRPPVVS